MSSAEERAWRAAEILATGDASLKERLRAAADQLTRALRSSANWPEKLLDSVRDITRQLNTDGESRATIDGMSGADARNMAERILKFALEVHTAGSPYSRNREPIGLLAHEKCGRARSHSNPAAHLVRDSTKVARSPA